MTKVNHEKSLIILKPDAIQRNLVGEIVSRFERKGLKITRHILKKPILPERMMMQSMMF